MEPGQRPERTVRGEAAVGQEHVDVGVEAEQLAGRLQDEAT